MVRINHEIKCGKCKVPIKGPLKPNRKSRFTCPSCGRSDTFDNIERVVQEYMLDKTAERMGREMEKATRGFESIKFKRQPRRKKVYRFVVDLH